MEMVVHYKDDGREIVVTSVGKPYKIVLRPGEMVLEHDGRPTIRKELSVPPGELPLVTLADLMKELNSKAAPDTEVKMVEITPTHAKRLKTAYLKATKDGKDIFEFEGNEYVTTYAKYLLSYIESQIGPLERYSDPEAN